LSTNLQSLSLPDAGWTGSAPDPLARPALYDGILWRRSFAYLVDACLILAINVAIHVGLILVGIVTLGLLLPIVLLAMSVIMFVTVAVLYDTLCVGGPKSATPGMRLFDVEARTWLGPRPDYLQAFLNSVLFYVSVSFTSFLILAVALFTPRHRALHDYLSGMVFVRRSA
jgi:uncharacterized RDD family membrane protein YckC